MKEDGSIRLRELEPDLLRGGDVRRFAAEKLFGFYDEQGNREEKPGIEGVFLRMESAPISVELAGGAEDKVVRVQFLLDDVAHGWIRSRPSAHLNAGRTRPARRQVMCMFPAPNLHKLVFTPDANAHGEYEIEFLVYDGEEIAEEAPVPSSLRWNRSSICSRRRPLPVTAMMPSAISWWRRSMVILASLTTRFSGFPILLMSKQRCVISPSRGGRPRQSVHCRSVNAGCAPPETEG